MSAYGLSYVLWWDTFAPQLSIEPIEKWGLDFIGPINPPSQNKEYIFVCTDYATKWVEVVALKHARDT